MRTSQEQVRPPEAAVAADTRVAKLPVDDKDFHYLNVQDVIPGAAINERDIQYYQAKGYEVVGQHPRDKRLTVMRIPQDRYQAMKREAQARANHNHKGDRFGKDGEMVVEQNKGMNILDIGPSLPSRREIEERQEKALIDGYEFMKNSPGMKEAVEEAARGDG